jgi:glucose-6-phosphate isomerase
MSANSWKNLSDGKGLLDLQTLNLGSFENGVWERIQDLKRLGFGSRLWRKDPQLWKTDPKDQPVIRNSLGWLEAAERMQKEAAALKEFAAEARRSGFRQVVHMGMGGSSLAPLVVQRILPRPAEGMELTILDTTDPATILSIDRSCPLKETLFIVASKSGTTAEPSAFGEFFFDRLKKLKGDRAGENFIAVTDPGTLLDKQGKERSFRKVFPGQADIGGRYSALSPFGIVPAALMGVDVAELLRRAQRMAEACGPAIPEEENPGAVLGAVMGEMVARGRDKVTFLTPEALSTLGLWLEQLLAESTGKEGTGILPVAEEPLGRAGDYAGDRLFVVIELKGEEDPSLSRLVPELIGAGHPVVAIQLGDRLDLAQEFYRWEVATAALGAILRINPFDQPNVQESKDNTNRLLDYFRRTGKLPDLPSPLREGALSFYGGRGGGNGREFLKEFFAQGRPHDYVALQAYLTETPEIQKAFESLRRLLQRKFRQAATFGYGPRFLHSTGQYHKGGPNTGLFLQFTADAPEDIPIPGSSFSFATLRRAQAQGDFEALQKHGRRISGIHLGGDAGKGLSEFFRILEETIGMIS